MITTIAATIQSSQFGSSVASTDSMNNSNVTGLVSNFSGPSANFPGPSANFTGNYNYYSGGSYVQV